MRSYCTCVFYFQKTFILYELLFFLFFFFFETFVSGRQYTRCIPDHYGDDCSGICDCSDYEDCYDGPLGDGSCQCRIGFEHLCGYQEILSKCISPPSLECMSWDHSTFLLLSVDPDTQRKVRQVSASLSRILPTPFRGPIDTIGVDPDVMVLLGLPLNESTRPEFAEYFTGRYILPGAESFAHNYGGHQFGNWAGQLGDGRSISLGHIIGRTIDNTSDFKWEIALKGAGKTPYSRQGDGRANLRNAIREFLADTTLVALGVPSVRSLAVFGGNVENDWVLRDEWYTGNVERLPAGVLVRVGPSFLRFGSFQLVAKRQGAAKLAALARYALKILADMEVVDDGASQILKHATLQKLYGLHHEQCFFRAQKPSCAAQVHTDKSAMLCLLQRVVERTAALVAAWMSVGFAHGVMNTDNISIFGITIDLNVYGFITEVDYDWAPNHIDDQKRYAFGKQESIARWNLRRLADAFIGKVFIADRENDRRSWQDKGDWLSKKDANRILGLFKPIFKRCFAQRMQIRLGLNATGEDDDVFKGWLDWLIQSKADYHKASRALVTRDATLIVSDSGAHITSDAQLRDWLSIYNDRLEQEAINWGGNTEQWSIAWHEQLMHMMPHYILRTNVVRDVAALNRPDLVEILRRILKNPFEEREGYGDEANLRKQLAALPEISNRKLTTSCGAQ